MTNLEKVLIEIAWSPWMLGRLLEGLTARGVLDDLICRGCRRTRGGCIAGDGDCPLPYGVADWFGWPYEAADGHLLGQIVGAEGDNLTGGRQAPSRADLTPRRGDSDGTGRGDPRPRR